MEDFLENSTFLHLILKWVVHDKSQSKKSPACRKIPRVNPIELQSSIDVAENYSSMSMFLSMHEYTDVV